MHAREVQYQGDGNRSEGDYVDFMCSDLTISANDAWDNSNYDRNPGLCRSRQICRRHEQRQLGEQLVLSLETVTKSGLNLDTYSLWLIATFLWLGWVG